MTKEMFVALLVAAAHAQPSDWYAEPVASSLSTVREPFLYRWQDNVTAVMSGPGASPLFRTTATRMDAHWRLAAYDIDAPLLFEEDQQRALEQAGMGALLALQLSTDQIISRSDEFATIQRSLRTLGGPSVVLRQQQEGLDVQFNERPRNQQVTMARMEEPQRSRSTAPGSRQASGRQLRLSSGLRVVDVTRTSQDGEDYTILRPALSLSADADRLGPISLRLRTAVLQERRRHTAFDWRAAVRLRTLPRVSLLGDIQGNEEIAERLQTGVEWRLPVAQAPITRLVGSRRVADGEQRLMLQLTLPMQWNIPHDIQRWPLGQTLDAPGPAPVLRKDIRPGPLVRLVPAQLAQDALALQRERYAAQPEVAMDEGS